MIKYKLICKNCNLIFDSWFASSIEYEKLHKKNFLSCHNCDSKNITKTLMAPRVNNKKKRNSYNYEIKKTKKIYHKVKEFQKFIKDNFDYVGKNFAYEARSIHYDKKKSKGIYGSASKNEIKELKEEGINIESVPWIEDNDKNN